MTDQDVVYDFRKAAPIPPVVHREMDAWLNRTSSFVLETWSDETPLDIELRFHGVESMRAPDAISQLQHPVTAFGIAMGDLVDVPSVFAFPRDIALTLIEGLLGQVPSEVAMDRDLSPAEHSMAAYLVETVTNAFRTSWRGDNLVADVLDEEHPLNAMWLLDAAKNVLVANFEIDFGVEESGRHCCWIVPQDELVLLIERSQAAMRPPQRPDEKINLEGHVCEMEAELRTVLGRSSINSEQLAQLQPGDVMVLDQRVRLPMTMYLAGKEHFLVKPGRVGPRQAVQIESNVREESDD